MPNIELPVVNGWEIDIANKRLRRLADNVEWVYRRTPDDPGDVHLLNVEPPPGPPPVDPMLNAPLHNAISDEAWVALRQYRAKPGSYSRFEVTCVSVGEPRTVRSIYVVAQVPEEAPEMAAESEHGKGFEEFRTTRTHERGLNGPARISGGGVQAFDIRDASPSGRR